MFFLALTLFLPRWTNDTDFKNPRFEWLLSSSAIANGLDASKQLKSNKLS